LARITVAEFQQVASGVGAVRLVIVHAFAAHNLRVAVKSLLVALVDLRRTCVVLRDEHEVFLAAGGETNSGVRASVAVCTAESRAGIGDFVESVVTAVAVLPDAVWRRAVGDTGRVTWVKTDFGVEIP